MPSSGHWPVPGPPGSASGSVTCTTRSRPRSSRPVGEHGVPLLVAPLGAPFSAISEHLAARRVEAQTAATRHAEALVSRLLAGLRPHASVATLLERAAG